MSLASRSRLVAAVLILGAIAAPAASAHLYPGSGGTSSATAQSRTTTAPLVVRPNPDQQTQQNLPGAPPILPRVPAAEQAAIDRAQAAEAQALSYSPSPTARYSSAEFNAYASAVHPVAATTPTVKAPGGGFDWGDAGIGAAGGLALSMLGLAGALMLSQRRGGRVRRSSSSAAPTG